jgi:hypothetical protein
MSDTGQREQSLEKRWDAELEKRGVAAVTVLLMNVGTGPGAMIQLGLGGGNPTRVYVEGWLGRKEAEAVTLAEHRHRETLEPARKGARWAFWAFLVGAAAAVLALIGLYK